MNRKRQIAPNEGKPSRGMLTNSTNESPGTSRMAVAVLKPPLYYRAIATPMLLFLHDKSTWIRVDGHQPGGHGIRPRGPGRSGNRRVHGWVGLGVDLGWTPGAAQPSRQKVVLKCADSSARGFEGNRSSGGPHAGGDALHGQPQEMAQVLTIALRCIGRHFPASLEQLDLNQIQRVNVGVPDFD